MKFDIMPTIPYVNIKFQSIFVNCKIYQTFLFLFLLLFSLSLLLVLYRRRRRRPPPSQEAFNVRIAFLFFLFHDWG